MNYIQVIHQSIGNGFDKSDKNFDKITNSFKLLQADLVIINAKIDKLDGNTSKNLKKVDVKLDNLKSEIKKISSVTGYDGIFQNMTVIKKANAK